MTWFDIKYGGQTYVENLTGGDEKTLVSLGFHGYATEAEAEAHPNTANYLQMLVASDILAGNVPVGATGIDNPSTIAQGAGTAASAGFTLAGLRLSWPGADTFLGRALKIIAGGVLLLAGIIKLSGAGRAVPVVAAAAGKLPGV